MAEQKRTGKAKAKKPYRPLRYFYLNGQLHKSLHINRGADQIITWNYPQGKRVVYTYSDLRKNKEPAFTTKEVAEMICRHVENVKEAVVEGKIEMPQYTYGLDENRNKFKYMWSEQDIMNIHAYFMTVHRGRPRKDGKITPQFLPTARELRAMIRQEPVLYVKTDDGEFVPTWRARDFS